MYPSKFGILKIMMERQQNLESVREGIIQFNLEMMDAEMLELLTAESIGGNAGDAETSEQHTYICATANGYVDQNGKIIAFGNYQNIPEHVTSHQKGFSFNVAFNPDMTVHKILEVEDKDGMTLDAMDVLKKCVDEFNRKYV